MLNMIKKVLFVSIIGIIAFPVIYTSIMFYEGQLRIEKGQEHPKTQEAKILRYSPVQDSMAVINSKIYEANLLQQKRLEQKNRQLAVREKRIQLLNKELTEKEKLIDRKKSEIREIVNSSKKLEDKKIKSLAKIYGSMRPEEAAPILQTLPDKLIISILRAISEDRQKAKILEKMNTEKASKISKAMGAHILKTRNRVRNKN